MKTFTKIIAAAVAAAGIISLAGCSNAKPDLRTVTNANWNVRNSPSVERSFADRWLNYKEVAEYSVQVTDGVNNTYSVKYTDATLRTEFYMTEFDWGGIADLPEGYGADKGKEYVYVYKTDLSAAGVYTLTKTGETKTFNDSVESTCYYRLAGSNLQPVYSFQKIKTTAPNELSAKSIESLSVAISGSYATYYDYDCTRATIEHVDDFELAASTAGVYTPSSKEISVTDNAGYSVFDNSQLWNTVRAFNINGGATHAFNVVVPQNGGVQLTYATCASPVVLNKDIEEQKQIIDALNECSRLNPDYIFFEDNSGEDEEARNYRFSAVSLGITVDTPMTGSNSTRWYSTVENGDVNYSKAVLLRMSEPLPFGLGTMNYTLKSLNLVPVAQ